MNRPPVLTRVRMWARIVDAAVELVRARLDVTRVSDMPGQYEVRNGVRIATGPWARHATVRQARAYGKLERAVRAYMEATGMEVE